jgi:hypothetical protein
MKRQTGRRGEERGLGKRGRDRKKRKTVNSVPSNRAKDHMFARA